MNRREFCLITGLLLAGSACGGVAAVRTEEHLQNFRAKKVFLESCDADVVGKQLEAIRRDGCDGVLLIPGRCSLSRWLERIDTEVSLLGLAVFVPARLSADLFRRVLKVRRFDDDGVLLLDGPSGILGLILYDRSRCRWTGFVPSGGDFVRDSEYRENAVQLLVARWLDRTMTERKPAWGGAQ